MKKHKQLQLYQGDIGLLEVTKLPQGARLVETGRTVLAYGESSGHHHVLHGSGVSRYELAKGAELVSYVEIAQALNDSGALALLEHPEHTTVQPPGGRIYKVLRQYEYRPSALPQRVAD